MRPTTFTLLLTLAPSALLAQTSAQTSAQANATIEASGPSRTAGNADGSSAASGGNADGGTAALSADATARFEAMRAEARDKRLPEQPLLNLMAEGRAKGATESQILTAESAALARLEVAQQALIRAGHQQPRGDEVAQGGEAVAHGATSAQLEVLARHAQSDRSLTVAFETLTQLEAQGVPVGRALSEIGSRLGAGASDASIATLASGSASADGSAQGALGSGHAAGAAATSVTGSAAGTTASLAGSVSGAVGRRP